MTWPTFRVRHSSSSSTKHKIHIYFLCFDSYTISSVVSCHSLYMQCAMFYEISFGLCSHLKLHVPQRNIIVCFNLLWVLSVSQKWKIKFLFLRSYEVQSWYYFCCWRPQRIMWFFSSIFPFQMKRMVCIELTYSPWPGFNLYNDAFYISRIWNCINLKTNERMISIWSLVTAHAFVLPFVCGYAIPTT